MECRGRRAKCHSGCRPARVGDPVGRQLARKSARARGGLGGPAKWRCARRRTPSWRRVSSTRSRSRRSTRRRRLGRSAKTRSRRPTRARRTSFCARTPRRTRSPSRTSRGSRSSSTLSSHWSIGMPRTSRSSPRLRPQDTEELAGETTNLRQGEGAAAGRWWAEHLRCHRRVGQRRARRGRQLHAHRYRKHQGVRAEYGRGLQKVILKLLVVKTLEAASGGRAEGSAGFSPRRASADPAGARLVVAARACGRRGGPGAHPRSDDAITAPRGHGARRSLQSGPS